MPSFLCVRFYATWLRRRLGNWYLLQLNTVGLKNYRRIIMICIPLRGVTERINQCAYAWALFDTAIKEFCAMSARLSANGKITGDSPFGTVVCKILNRKFDSITNSGEKSLDHWLLEPETSTRFEMKIWVVLFCKRGDWNVKKYGLKRRNILICA